MTKVRRSGRYVSRGGDKLAGALADFLYDPMGMRACDVGCGSGGFTDCLLQHGAVQVTAVDVGYGQFDYKLRVDERVVLFERTNIATAEPGLLGAPFELVCADISFNSLTRLAVTLFELLAARGAALLLVKPQFELPRSCVTDGIVRDPALHEQALRQALEACQAVGLAPQALAFSHLKGAKGNIEYWLWATKGAQGGTIDPAHVVQQAHKELVCL